MEIKLGDAAEIMRCQLPRDKVLKIEEAHLGLKAGGILEGRTLLHEVFTEDLEKAPFKFVPEAAYGMTLVKMNREREKFLIRKGDILITAIGIRKKIGYLGFAAASCQPSITSRNIVICRSKGEVDPVWLYYRLHQPDLRAKLEDAASSGSKLMVLSMEALRDITFEEPWAEEVQRVGEVHAGFVKDARTIQKIKMNERMRWDHLSALYHESGQIDPVAAAGSLYFGQPEIE